MQRMRWRRAAWLTLLAAGLSVLSLPAAAADLADVRRGGVLRIGTSGDYAPFSTARDGGYQGFDVELTARLAKDLGVRVVYVRFAWPQLTDDLTGDRFDVTASGITVRPERALAGRYARPYAMAGAVAMVRAEARIADRAALDRPGVRIVVNRGGHLERVARRLFRHATIEPVGDNASLPNRVLGGSADAALTDELEVRAWQRKELRVIGPFTRDRKALLVRRDAPELAQWIDRWLRARERDGWLPRLRKQWFGDEMLTPAGADREAVLQDLDLRCGLMPAVAASKHKAELPIEDPAQEKRVIERATAAARNVGLNPSEITKLFESLIRSAKAIQLAAGTDPHVFAPPLEQLRNSLAEIDTHLIRQLRDAVRTVKAPEWRAGIREGVTTDGLSEAYKADLAAALVQVRTLEKPAAAQTPPEVP